MLYVKINSLKLNDPGYPEVLRHISGPPKQLYWAGADPNEWLSRPKVAVVGSRKISPYGKNVTTQLAQELARAGVIVISAWLWV